MQLNEKMQEAGTMFSYISVAHLIPEMTANLVVPIAIAVYIFTIDWRMGLASLVTTIVGMTAASGSGKTYAQRWDVTDGSITLGGKDIRKIPLDQLNQRIAYVSQDNYLFDRSVRDNIRMGRLDASDEEIEEAAKAAGCDEFIRVLDQEYDTVCGGGGGHLSGGEKQRISIARAMLKNAPIVILDEATASIDPENEALIQQAISELTQGKTLIIIAHRLGTIADADKIVVIQNGNLMAQGKQEELLADCPLYADMWQAFFGSRDLVKEEEACLES